MSAKQKEIKGEENNKKHMNNLPQGLENGTYKIYIEGVLLTLDRRHSKVCQLNI